MHSSDIFLIWPLAKVPLQMNQEDKLAGKFYDGKCEKAVINLCVEETALLSDGYLRNVLWWLPSFKC